MRHIMLRLEGPMMAFGDVAVDERMPTARFPALSMVCGMLANAAGMLRSQPAAIQRLQDTMEIASRLDRPGERTRDFQTAELAKDDRMWTSRGVVATRGGGASTYNSPNILIKEYLADASVTVAAALPDADVDGMAEALRNPARTLFLGRAGCPPTREIFLGILEATDVLDALRRWPVDDGGATHLDAQWPERLGAGGGTRAVQGSDIKDWANKIHTGVRRVTEGRIQVEATP